MSVGVGCTGCMSLYLPSTIKNHPQRLSDDPLPDRSEQECKNQINDKKEGKYKTGHHKEHKDGRREMGRPRIAVHPKAQNRQTDRCNKNNQECRFVSHDFIFSG